MSDTNTNPDGTAADVTATETTSDHIEEKEDEREQEQLDTSLEGVGLLPVPEATPTDGQAPGA